MGGRRKVGVALVVVFGLLGLPVAVAPHIAGASHCPSHGAKFEPADGSRLLIIGQDRDQAVAYATDIGVPGGFMTYTNVGGTVAGLHAPINFGGTSHGQHYVDNYPSSAIQVALGLSQEELVGLGVWDTNIQILGDWIKAANRPVFLRIGYEFDGNHNEYTPAAFVTAWRHIVDRLRAQGVTNVAYVWHSASKGTWQGFPMSSWYPGDSYVDWTAVSLFNVGQLVYANEMADFADTHGKPLMIAESTPHGWYTPTHGAQVWSAWHEPILDFIETRDVKAWSYINQNWETAGWPGWGDSRVQAHPAVRDLWLAEISQPTWLQASPTLFCALGHE